MAELSLESFPVSLEKKNSAAAQIDLHNPTLTISYGASTMQEIAKFADSLLSNVRVKDSGPVGEGLSTLLLKVKDVKIDEIAKHEKSFLESIPLIGSLFNSVEKTMAQFNTVLDQIDGISDKLEEAMLSLLKDIEVLEQLYALNKGFYEDLTAYIVAGEERLAYARDTELVALEEEAKKSQDGLAAQNVRDFADKINRFDRRLHDLKLSRTITLQTAPQIRMIQNNDRTLAEKIQTSILTTIPIWKNQMVIALSVNGQREAAQLQKDVSDTTNEMLRKNAELLHDTTIATAREVERSAVDIETLRDVHEKLLSTIEESISIAEEGRAKRHSAEVELQNMEKDLRNRLTDLASVKANKEVEEAKTPSRRLGQFK